MLLALAAVRGPSEALRPGAEYRFKMRAEAETTIKGRTTSGAYEEEVIVLVNKVEGNNITFTTYSTLGAYKLWMLVNESFVSVAGSSSDYDGDGYAEWCGFSLYGHIFVNPDWSKHKTGWNSSITNVKNQPCVESVKEQMGGGEFYVKVVVKVEWDLDDDGEREKGTYTFTGRAEYDSDGVLELLSEYEVVELEEGIRYVSHRTMERYKPLTILGFELPVIPPLEELPITDWVEEKLPFRLPFPIDYLYLLVILVIGLVIGFVIGRRRRKARVSAAAQLGLPTS